MKLRKEKEKSNFLFSSFLAVCFRGQILPKARPDWSPLGVKFKISDEHPHLFHIGVPPGVEISVTTTGVSIEADNRGILLPTSQIIAYST